MIVYCSELVCQICDQVIATTRGEVFHEPRGNCPADPRHKTIVLTWNEEQPEGISD